MRPAAVALALSVAMPRVARAQDAPDTLRLGVAHERAAWQDPRAAQLKALSAQSALRLRNLDAELRPALGLDGLAQYLSDVPRIPVAGPGAPPPQPHEQYDARMGATQRLLDPTLGPRRALERAQHGEAEARVRVAIFAVRQAVNDAYFGALRAQMQRDELRGAIAALEANRAVAAARVREGAALPSEEHAITVEVLRSRQALADAEIARAAALAVLRDLTGIPADSGTALAVPDLAAATSAALGADSTARARPEFARFDQARAVIAEQARARDAQDRARLSAFGRAGYGRPGLNPLATDFDSYWLAGVQLQWAPWNWGARARDREVLALQRRIVDADEQAFADHLRRAVTMERATIQRLEAALALDDDIITLRLRIAEETRVRFAEGAVTSGEYVTRQTELLSARVDRALHRAALAEARARLLTTLGLEVR